MRGSFATCLVLAGFMASSINALCVDNLAGDDICNNPDMADLVDKVEAAVEAHAGDYAWTFENAKTGDGYDLRLIRFRGDMDN